MKLYHPAQAREIDRVAIEEWGIPGVVLMENAGAGTAQHLRELIGPPQSDKPIAIFAGIGNNGGDGYVIARHLLNHGYLVWTFLCDPETPHKEDATINLQILQQMTDQLFLCTEQSMLAPWLPRLATCSAIVDALLGTGLTREISGWYLALIEALNEISGPHKLAVDVPSGLDALSGRPTPLCFQADTTTTYACAKVGLVSHDAVEHVGKLEIIDIGVPQSIIAQMPELAHLQDAKVLQRAWPKHIHNSHKGNHGHLLVVAGAQGTLGAAMLSAQAALRTGAGLCTLATPAEVTPRVEGRIPEIMCAPLPPGPEGLDALSTLWQGKNAIAFGPGLGQKDEPRRWLKMLLDDCHLSAVIDADGLNLIADMLPELQQRHAPTVLTPHPGEMARLTGRSTSIIQANRVDLALNFAQVHGVTLVLKGAQTVIAAPNGRCWINPTGNPGMATAGSGDLLTGMIGALLARGCDSTYAACAAVFLHGLTADQLVPETGYSGMIATDILQKIPSTLATWEQT